MRRYSLSRLVFLLLSGRLTRADIRSRMLLKRYVRTGRDGAFPPEFDPETCRRFSPDLAGFNDEELIHHYETHGRKEGRVSSLPALREHFLPLLSGAPSILEIGPFCNPIVRGENVSYFDVLDGAGLEQRANAIGYPIQVIPEIDYVSPVGDLAVVDRRFSAVLSAHCIEHQPDLIHHLQQVADILEPDGHYYVIVPDKLYCFDHFIAESTLAGIIDAHVRGLRVHRLASVIEHRALVTHNDAPRHWRGDHADPGLEQYIVPRTKAAVEEFMAANGAYIDVHAWQFTPRSFRTIMQSLHDLGYSPLRPVRVYDTPFNRLEFTAILEKP